MLEPVDSSSPEATTDVSSQQPLSLQEVNEPSTSPIPMPSTEQVTSQTVHDSTTDQDISQASAMATSLPSKCRPLQYLSLGPIILL